MDLEGASGISASDYVLKDGYLYAVGRRLITKDINAAVSGAFDGHGAAERATLEHTMNSKNWQCFKVNGKSYGHPSEMYGGNWSDYGIEQLVF